MGETNNGRTRRVGAGMSRNVQKRGSTTKNLQERKLSGFEFNRTADNHMGGSS